MAVSTTAGEPPKLHTEELTMRFGSLTALEPTDLAVPNGEFLTLLGPSGSGKTTLLQLICGLLRPAGGRVYIDGRDQSDVPVHRRDIGLVFQHYALFPHLTVAENVAFPLKMRKVPAAEIERSVRETLDMVHLPHLSGRFPRELSGGQQQRVALARCFVYRPSIILMDEPLGALDKKLREGMQIEIMRLHRETGSTIVYVTHDQEEALAMSDRICLMNHARIEQLGSPSEIYNSPRTEFAANFIGLSNIFRGDLISGSKRLKTPYGEFVLPEGREVTGSAIVVRPEFLTLGNSEQNALSGTVRDVVYAGSETRLISSLDDGQEFVVRVPVGHTVPKIGETITASWNPNAATVVP